MISNRFSQLLLTLGLLTVLISQPLVAETIEAKLPSGIIASAELHVGKPGLPMIVLIHGFMQTREFPTVNRLAEGLGSAGYSTLSPTLSLGISRRARSLPCEAIHRHTLEQDVAEIDFWMDWIARHKPGPVVLVSHSYGSLQSLLYASNKPSAALRQVIALSLVDAERQAPSLTVNTMLGDAKKRIARGDKELVSYPFGYCKKYVSTPQGFYSYAHWTRADILQLSRKSKVPLEVVMGGGDDRMGEDWPEKLRTIGNHVQVIAGANHFFDAEHEFEVLDLTLSLLNSSREKK